MMATDERPLEEEVEDVVARLHSVADRLVATVERIEADDGGEEPTPDEPDTPDES